MIKKILLPVILFFGVLTNASAQFTFSNVNFGLGAEIGESLWIKNNNQSINESFRLSTNFMVSLSIDHRINKKWFWRNGIKYNHQDFKHKVENILIAKDIINGTTSSMDGFVKKRDIGLFSKVFYRPGKGKKRTSLAVFSGIGLKKVFITDSNRTWYGAAASDHTFTNLKEYTFRPINITSTIGLQLDFRLNKKWHIGLSPFLEYTLRNDYFIFFNFEKDYFLFPGIEMNVSSYNK